MLRNLPVGPVSVQAVVVESELGQQVDTACSCLVAMYLLGYVTFERSLHDDADVVVVRC